MDIHHSIREGSRQLLTEDDHESGQNDQIGFFFLKCRDHTVGVFLTSNPFFRDDTGLDAVILCTGQRVCVQRRRDDTGNFARSQFAAFFSIDQRL